MGGIVMPYCPNCRSEYREGIVKCVDCGAALVPGSPPPVEEPEPSNEELVPIYRAGDEVEAKIVRAVLEEAGIPVLETGGLTHAVGYVLTTGPFAAKSISIFVPASRAEDAKLALEKARAADGD